MRAKNWRPISSEYHDYDLVSSFWNRNRRCAVWICKVIGHTVFEFPDIGGVDPYPIGGCCLRCGLLMNRRAYRSKTKRE